MNELDHIPASHKSSQLELPKIKCRFYSKDNFSNRIDVENAIQNWRKNSNSNILIFDRYGKLLKEISPSSAGWNGTINGERMRASDYWFLAKLERANGDVVTYRGHFSLVR